MYCFLFSIHGGYLKKIFVLSIKITLSVALIWFALSKIDLAAAIGLIREISLPAVAACLCILIVQQLLASQRLNTLLRSLGTTLSLKECIDAVMVGVFFSQTFISFLGGDAMRVWRIASHHTTVSVAARAVLLDRVSGFVGLILLILMSLPFVLSIVPDSTMRLGIEISVGIGLMATMLFFALAKLPDTFRRWRLSRLLMDVAEQMLLTFRNPKRGSTIIGVSILIQALNPAAAYAIALGLGVESRLIDFLILVPPVLLLAMLPISFAGWGVREGAMVVALGLVGISPEHSVAVSVCFGLALVTIGLPGGVLWFIKRKKPPLSTTKPDTSVTPS